MRYSRYNRNQFTCTLAVFRDNFALIGFTPLIGIQSPTPGTAAQLGVQLEGPSFADDVKLQRQ